MRSKKFCYIDIPLNLVIKADDYSGDLAKWPLDLPSDGTQVGLQAPHVDLVGIPVLSHVGQFDLPVRITDEKALDHAVVYANGRKIAWLNGGESVLNANVSLDLEPGLNRIIVLAKDNEKVTARRSLRIWAEDAASVDAGIPPQDP